MRENKPKMWPQRVADARKRSAGKPYRPSNGTEGDIFESQWCLGCHFNGRCGVLIYSMGYAADEKGYPKELVIGPDGQPECTKFKEPVPAQPRRQHKPSKGQGGLF
jgi:hypothetical protein